MKLNPNPENSTKLLDTFFAKNEGGKSGF